MFSQTFAHGNSKNEIRQRTREGRQEEKSVYGEVQQAQKQKEPRCQVNIAFTIGREAIEHHKTNGIVNKIPNK